MKSVCDFFSVNNCHVVSLFSMAFFFPHSTAVAGGVSMRQTTQQLALDVSGLQHQIEDAEQVPVECMPGSINSHDFHIIGDKHINPIQ